MRGNMVIDPTHQNETANFTRLEGDGLISPIEKKLFESKRNTPYFNQISFEKELLSEVSPMFQKNTKKPQQKKKVFEVASSKSCLYCWIFDKDLHKF